MVKVKSPPVTDVGVIVGRFQVPFLHEGHIDLIQSVVDKHSKVIIVLGLSPCKSTINNPLDYEARKQMILEKFPMINLFYLKDQPLDVTWSKMLDEIISDVISPGQTCSFYGSRDSFIKRYSGKFPCIELEPDHIISGSEIRNKVKNQCKPNADFRAGVIWCTHNRYPSAIPTVDIAIFDESGTRLLLGKKPNEDKWRFVGGFAQPGETYEMSAIREATEETSLEVGDLKYVGSAVIDDWRYRGETDKITTLLFRAKMVFGRPTPQDDISELKWFDVSVLKRDELVENHRKLLDMLSEDFLKNNNK